MILLAEAGRAKDIANALKGFLDSVDRDGERKISDSIAELDHLRHNLRELHRSLDDRRRYVDTLFKADVELLQHSVAYTLGDVWSILGKMPPQPIGHDYQMTWKDISRHCQYSSRSQTLPDRLHKYNMFAMALVRNINSRGSVQYLIEDLRKDILSLRLAQLRDRHLITATDAIEDLAALTIRPSLPPIPDPPPLANSAAMRQPRSTERVRPPNNRTMSSTDSTMSWGSSVQRPSISSPTLSPISPTTTFSTISQPSSADVETKHWAGHIFSDLPSTDIVDAKNEGQPSECMPAHAGDGDEIPHPDEFEKILQIKFSGFFKCQYWIRHRDYQTKIVCQWPHPRSLNRCDQACLPLNDLHIKRSGSMLYLCRAIPNRGQNVAWAAFRFPTIEFLIVFHCTFVALRAYDGRRTRPVDPFDHDLENEREYFSGPISDNGYHHRLRILRDRSTDVLRLEASVLSGVLVNTPIWTAFITHHVLSPKWLKHSPRPTTILMSDLKRHIFSPDYRPHVANSGAHVLDFDKARDASAFARTILEFGDRYRKNASASSKPAK